MRYYTYKVTFKDLPGYFYYGSHKDDGKPYFGIPVTWARFWTLFEAEVQIMQWYETEGEVRRAEKVIIDATWRDKYSLNEHNGYSFSEDTCRGNGRTNMTPDRAASLGRKTGPDNVKAMNDHSNTTEARSDNGKKTGPLNVKAMAGHSNSPEGWAKGGTISGPANGSRTGELYGGINRKGVSLTKISTGETFDFPSALEASRALRLNHRHVANVARGERRSHKGYTAAYL